MTSKHIKTIFLYTAIILLSFHYNFKALQKGIQRFKRGEPDQITIYEKRFLALKATLENHSIVGYVSDYDDNPDENGIAFSKAQYVLAPIRLVRGTKRDFIIGNFQNVEPDINAFEKENLSVYKNFGNGVILFERMDN